MRLPDPALEKVFVLHERGMNLYKAWQKNGEPTTWGNVTKQWKARCGAREPAPAAPSSSRSTSRKRAAAVEPTPAKRPAPPPSTGRTGPAISHKKRRSALEIEHDMADNASASCRRSCTSLLPGTEHAPTHAHTRSRTRARAHALTRTLARTQLPAQHACVAGEYNVASCRHLQYRSRVCPS